jgi:glycosyltransferase involved in cell wall biosynthesis
VCAPTVPAFDRESGNKRIHDSIVFLVEDGWDVTFVGKSHSPDDARHARALRQLGVATYINPGARFGDLVTSGRFDVAIMAFWFIAELWAPVVRAITPATRIIADPIDLHFLRGAREVRGGANLARPVLDPQFAELMAREVNAYIGCDAVMAVSAKEADFLNDLVGGVDLARAVEDNDCIPASPIRCTDRSGLLFLGNFKHPPNVEAGRFLLSDVLPHIDPAVLGQHPLRVIGNAMPGDLAALGNSFPSVSMVGWVPSVTPYLASARVSLVPLLNGAGTKRKTVQSAIVGTPVVSTPVGVEGLPLADDTDVLIASDAETFAHQIERLATDDTLWESLRRNARRKTAAVHGREVVRSRFLALLGHVLARDPKPARLFEESLRLYRKNLYVDYAKYSRNAERFCAALSRCTPPGSTTAVISRGDDDLLKADGREARHFPMDEAGRYVGFHPADDESALAHLEFSRKRGASFLAIPASSAWWLDYYKGFREYLEKNCSLAYAEDDVCVVYELRKSGGAVLSKARGSRI